MNSTLALKKADYEAEIGSFLGFGRGEARGDVPWTSAQETIVRFDCASGIRRFYYCGHPWSFMHPVAELTLRSGERTVSLPDDFGGVDAGAEISITTDSGGFRAAYQFCGQGRVEKAYSNEQDATGPPVMIAMRPIKKMEPGKMQTMELHIYPEADQDYTLRFPYFFNANYLTDVTPYVYGGVENHEAILECCLAVAEMRRDNTVGVHAMEANRLLAIAISLDKRRQPKHLGYNYDRSDDLGHDERWNRSMTISNGVIINGVLYD